MTNEGNFNVFIILLWKFHLQTTVHIRESQSNKFYEKSSTQKRLPIFHHLGAVGGDEATDEDKEKAEEEERERKEAIQEAEERRKEKHRKMEEEREKMRQDIRDKVNNFTSICQAIADLNFNSIKLFRCSNTNLKRSRTSP